MLLRTDNSPEKILTFLLKLQAIIHISLIPNIMALAKKDNTQTKYFETYPANTLCSLWDSLLQCVTLL